MRVAKGPRPGMEIFEADQTDSELKSLYPDLQANLADLTSLRTTIGGWAHASDASRRLADRASHAGVSFVTGKRSTVLSREVSRNRVTGVRTAAGVILRVHMVVLATGLGRTDWWPTWDTTSQPWASLSDSSS
ncbi:hypothetical protein EDB80DRAFT_690785 [Ilyonectria destructans]|nr:hypothetical protein EDB80DRAFT_690785 [Ilyonectria destructans]